MAPSQNKTTTTTTTMTTTMTVEAHLASQAEPGRVGVGKAGAGLCLFSRRRILIVTVITTVVIAIIITIYRQTNKEQMTLKKRDAPVITAGN